MISSITKLSYSNLPPHNRQQLLRLVIQTLECMSLFRYHCCKCKPLVMWPKIAERRSNVANAMENIVRSNAHPLLHCAQSATVSTRLVMDNAPDIVGNQQFLKLKLHPRLYRGLQVTPTIDAYWSSENCVCPLVRDLSSTACCTRGKPDRIFRPDVFNLFCTAAHFSNPLWHKDPHLKLE